jgi:hypothetical protein
MFVAPVRAALLAALAVVVLAPAAAADFPPITDAEKALTTLPSDPSAPAVVLFEKARCQLLDYPREIISRLEVQVRVKILTEEGKDLFGEVAIAHSRVHRLHAFAGRTVLPDGRVVPVGDDAIFRDTTSRSQRQFVTKAAFPALEVGAILDYSYTLVWDSFFNLDPWYFANSVPTLHSEIAYLVPPSLAAQPWGREVGGVKLAIETERQAQGTLLRATAKNVPAIPDEPDSFPFGDLSSRFMLVPTKVVFAGGELELMASWDAVCDIMERGYKELRQGKRRVRRQGKELANGLQGGERTRAIYRFVRDEIQTAPSFGIFPNKGTLDRALKDGGGSLIEKSLMLIEMLDAAGIASDLVWAASRFDGRVDPDLANPGWFDRPLVRVIEAGEPVFLDPADPRLGYGQLLPGFEGMAAVVYAVKDPQVIELPPGAAEDHQRHAKLDLVLDGEGRVSGSGSLRATGHHSWAMRIVDAVDDGWKQWLENRFDGFDVSEIEVTDDREGQAIEATWKMTMRDEAVLGDEVSLQPSRPFGPLTQPYTLPHEQRRTPVQLAFADVDRVDLVATWPEGWEVEVAPEPLSVDGPAGDVEVTVAVDEAARRLTYGRLLRIDHVEFAAGGEYEALRRTMAAMERGDAQDLVLVAE